MEHTHANVVMNKNVDPSFLEEVKKTVAGKKILDCIQCGVCAGLLPRQICHGLRSNADHQDGAVRSERRCAFKLNHMDLCFLLHLHVTLSKRNRHSASDVFTEEYGN